MDGKVSCKHGWQENDGAKTKRRQPLQRTDLHDTRIEGHRSQIEGLRKLPPEEKVRRCMEMRDSSRLL
ncbi:MAG: hypothetical protein D8M22_03930 [Armatimonadetes bacterium]|nr:hypothetical protein [Armatimonadota bacterium]